ncbi:hypothetical protein QO000_001468 [Alkalihalobacillus hemicentroti]|uniref:Uncharacterized protein n=1 Tax=Guptibacillus hwajinpoensis TaxID=208199 RepID=A0ABU0K2G4_9BACL|nr:hypothetical protein [Alkalihalobacillus hemicentroti]
MTVVYVLEKNNKGKTLKDVNHRFLTIGLPGT